MNNLKIFQSEIFGKVRVLLDDNDEVWFVGKDVSETLGYTDLRRMYDHVEIEDKIKINPHSSESLENAGFGENGLNQKIEENENIKNLVIINESGLYQAIFGSKLPSAKAFKRWVTKEVLPQIRQTGSYNIENTKANLLLSIYEGGQNAILSAKQLTELEIKKEQNL